jgi:magnesium transporter
MINEIIDDMYHKKEYAKLRDYLREMEPADVAELLTNAELEEDELIIMFRILPKELAADVFVEMEPDMQETLIKSFSDKELEEVMDQLYLDDTVDIIEEMPANVVRRILRHTDPELRRSINTVLHYPKDSAGSIMTIEYVDLRKDMTVLDAFTRIRRVGIDKETI